MEKVKRYLILLLGLFISSVGVVLITKGNLGTSCISSVPYVLSLIFPMSMGAFTILFSLVLIVAQLLILGKNFKPEHVLQIPVSILFGWFIDLVIPIFGFIDPQTYPEKLLVVLIGCVIVGISIYLEVLADVVMLPGESFVRSVVKRWGTEFGATKITFDVSISALAAAISLICTGKLMGVREGTLIASILVGYIARWLKKKLDFLPEKLFS
ncbi:MAG: YitT family protein [Faecousia sp.]